MRVRACCACCSYKQSLDALMRQQPGRRFALDQALRYSLDMARAIAELHACSIIIQGNDASSSPPLPGPPAGASRALQKHEQAAV